MAHIISRRRIHPSAPPSQRTSRLSTTDATSTRFSACAGLWLFDGPSPSFEDLETSLAQVLDLYPHFAGHLHYADNSRIAWPAVTYGSPTDPGVEFLLAEDERRLEELVPEERGTVWDMTSFPQHDFLPNLTELALFGGKVVPERAAMAVQLTEFSCGGFGVGVALTHCLSDATTLVQLVKAWAAVSQSQEVVPPVFQPDLLDRTVGLDDRDEDRIIRAQKLPVHRYDWWDLDAPGIPDWARSGSQEFMAKNLEALQIPPSVPPPWETWDMAAPVRHVFIRLSAAELTTLKARAMASLPEAKKQIPLSRLDAATAFIWSLINRARLLQESTEPVYLDASLGIRQRRDPPLPETFVGPAIIGVHVAMSGVEACTASLGIVAAAIRESLSLFTPEVVGDLLHDSAHDVCPHRLWRGFLGRQHVMYTSWTRSGAYKVSFDDKMKPRYVFGIMPKMDGLLQIMDVEGTGDFELSVCLEAEAMGRLLRDSALTELICV